MNNDDILAEIQKLPVGEVASFLLDLYRWIESLPEPGREVLTVALLIGRLKGTH